MGFFKICDKYAEKQGIEKHKARELLIGFFALIMVISPPIAITLAFVYIVCQLDDKWVRKSSTGPEPKNDEIVINAIRGEQPVINGIRGEQAVINGVREYE